ncbi:fructosamine kinase family protein [Pseudohalioglobus sediminis]|uniref:Fructosamine kinase family protein n=1 Tax=Pseudohalioglobus sediminis TaxID=2606449 RepID=A0A5B0WRL3_9GAMM|nr:fructosamine kinase family protein [Pseudohalioglobus sediminis]KAA1189516.1 fructosamine kinase family protein [Pseudohalioglobus sediminis]
MWQDVEASINQATGERFRVRASYPVAGGCINESAVLEDGGKRYFVKRNLAALEGMFHAEAAALREIIATHSLGAPAPVATGCDGKNSWLVLEYLDLTGTGGAAEAALGLGLARMHRHQAGAFGFHDSNFIGATPQPNNWHRDWVAFFGEQRLHHQLSLAAQNGAGHSLLDAGERLLERLPGFFDRYTPLPSLLHGDLWGGNWAAEADGNPVIFDPAAYYGDREADLAMTELFGGFGDRFYHSYRDAWDIDPGYATRKVLYNLYHILNHFNLFGGGYERQARDMIDRLLAEV